MDEPARAGIGRRLAEALRIACFAKPRRALAPSWLEIVAAAFLVAAIPTAYSLATLGAAGRWAPWELPQALFFIPLALAAAATIAWLARRAEAVPETLFAALLAWIVIDLATLAAWTALAVRDAPLAAFLEPVFTYAPLAWLALAVSRFALTLGPVSAPRQGWILVAAVALLAWPRGWIGGDRSLWVRDWGDERAEAAASVASEAAFYRQPELLARELASVQPGRKGLVDVYFVGVAGYGGEDVFMREIDAVARLMRERFDAGGRTVKLVNNPKTALTTPIATTTSLRAALKATASAMDGDEDVLVLFLTSHGSADHRFSISLFPMRFDDLTPDALRDALDASGIRNRVVVVSSCYAGGFVERLRAEYTLVIAAAAPDRNSFGCSNEADWTYFGRAYFDQALRRTYSFIRAFELALPAIAAREKAGNYPPSQPVMAAGNGIRAKLEELEAQLRSHRVALR